MTEARPGSGNVETVLGNVELRHIPGFVAVMLTTLAPYSDLAAPLVRLKTWAAEVDVIGCGNTVALFYADPTTSVDEPRRVSLCLPISAPDAQKARAALTRSVAPPLFAATAAPADPAKLAPPPLLAEGDVVEVREFPRGLSATVFYRGPLARASAAYSRLAEWVGGRPYLPSGTPREVLLAEPAFLGPDVTEIEVHQPVVPGGR